MFCGGGGAGGAPICVGDDCGAPMSSVDSAGMPAAGRAFGTPPMGVPAISSGLTTVGSGSRVVFIGWRRVASESGPLLRFENAPAPGVNCGACGAERGPTGIWIACATVLSSSPSSISSSVRYTSRARPISIVQGISICCHVVAIAWPLPLAGFPASAL